MAKRQPSPAGLGKRKIENFGAPEARYKTPENDFGSHMIAARIWCRATGAQGFLTITRISGKASTS